MPEKSIVGFSALMGCLLIFTSMAKAGDPPQVVGQMTIASTPPPVLWTAQTDYQTPMGIVGSPTGFYVTSDTAAGSGRLASYSSVGTQLWEVTLPTLNTAVGCNIACDGSGNIYVAGIAGGAGVILQKYSSDGSYIWGQAFAGPYLYYAPLGLAVTSGGTSYVTSRGMAEDYSIPPVTTYTNIRAYQTDGTLDWTANLNPGDGTYPGGSTSSQSTSLDGQGNIISAFTNYTNVNNSIPSFNYLSKTNAQGQVQWIENIPNGSSLLGTAVDTANNIYLANGELTKYGPSGNVLWNVTTNVYPFFADCIGPDGTIYAVGDDGIISAFDSSGDQLWTETIAAPRGTLELRFEDVSYSNNELLAIGQEISSSQSGDEILAISVPEPGSFALLVVMFFMLPRSFAPRAWRCKR
jgi:hypothetical protein